MPATHFQAGILDGPPEHVLVAALSFVQSDGPSCQAAVGNLRELIRRELAADIDEIDPESNPAAPTADTGELGVDTGYDTTRLTITVGVSASGFQKLGVPDPPQDLIPINWGWFSDNPANPNEGDLVLQICAESSYIVEHVLRRIEHEQGPSFVVVWTLAGEQRNGGSHGGTLTADSARALIGFHDGLSNLNPKDPIDQQLIFVNQEGAPAYPPTPGGQQPAPQPDQPAYGQPGAAGPIFPGDLRQPPSPEPPWATDGTYLMVRASMLNIGGWDQQSLQQQQETIGRWKYSGATLDNPNSPAYRRNDPGFTATPNDVQVPPNSHIRRANPRALATDPQRRIFRRGYPMMLGTPQGTLQRGLLFLGFGRSLSTQVEFIMRAWLKNPNFPQPQAGVDPLLGFEAPPVLAGGYYFIPPVANPAEPWNVQLPGV